MLRWTYFIVFFLFLIFYIIIIYKLSAERSILSVTPVSLVLFVCCCFNFWYGEFWRRFMCIRSVGVLLSETLKEIQNERKMNNSLFLLFSFVSFLYYCSTIQIKYKMILIFVMHTGVVAVLTIQVYLCDDHKIMPLWIGTMVQFFIIQINTKNWRHFIRHLCHFEFNMKWIKMDQWTFFFIHLASCVSFEQSAMSSTLHGQRFVWILISLLCHGIWLAIFNGYKSIHAALKIGLW